MNYPLNNRILCNVRCKLSKIEKTLMQTKKKLQKHLNYRTDPLRCSNKHYIKKNGLVGWGWGWHFGKRTLLTTFLQPIKISMIIYAFYVCIANAMYNSSNNKLLLQDKHIHKLGPRNQQQEQQTKNKVFRSNTCTARTAK